MNETAKLADTPGIPEEQTIANEIVFSGKIWNVIRKTFRFHDQQLSREYIEHPGAVAVLAIDENDRVVVIKQFRAPVNEYLVEIPAGLLDPEDATSLAAAKRELLEESDYLAKNWAFLQRFFTSPGSSSEAIDIFLATGLEKISHNFTPEGEEIHMEKNLVPYPQLLESVKMGRVKSPTLVVAVLAYEAKRLK